MRRALIDMRPDRFEDIDCAGRALPAGTDGEHPDLLRAQARPRDDRLPSSETRADPARDLRHHHLSGAGDADRAQISRATRSARPICCAAPWARRSEAEMEAQRGRFVSGAVERGVEQATAEAIFERLRANSPNTASTRSIRRPTRCVTYQTAYMKANYPVEFLAASMTLRHGQHRQARRIPRRGRAAGHQGRAALDQSLGRRIRGRRQHHPLRAGGAARRRPPGGRERSSPRAASEPFADLADFARRINPRAVNKRVLESLVAAGAFDAIEKKPGARSRRRRTPSSPPRSAPTRTPRSASRSCSAALPRARRSFCRRSNPGCRPSGCNANTTPSASSSAAIRSTIMPPRSSGCACSPGRSSRAP